MKPLELRDRLLEGETLTSTNLAEIMKCEEGQHLEFKEGSITGRPQAKATIRKAVTGFANVDGGLLVVGVTNSPPRRIAPCENPGRRPLSTWGNDLLNDLAHYFSPLPRTSVISTSDGDALVFAVPRAPALVPLPISGKLQYYLRLGDQTIPAPESLLSDLLLGRRQHPRLRLQNSRVHYRLRAPDSTLRFPRLGDVCTELTFYFDVENDGLLHVDHLLLGVVTWATAPIQAPINSHLRSYIEIVEPPSTASNGQFHLLHLSAEPSPDGASRNLAPFTGRPFRTAASGLTLSNARLKAAVYLLPKGSEPTWYQMTLEIPAYNPDNDRQGDLTGAHELVRGRPTVSCEPL